MSIIQGVKASAASGASKVSDFLDNLANKYIVKPKSAKGLGGFVFDYEGETEVLMRAEITAHFTEQNSFLQDHIAIQPQKIILHGMIGELVKKPKDGLLGALDVLQDRLTTVPAYLQDYTPGAVQTAQKALTKAQNVISSVDQALTRAQNLYGNIYGFFKDSGPKSTAQQRAYSLLYSLFLTRQIFSVDTPFDYHPNMAIETFRFLQDADTKHLVDISITLVELRTAETQLTTFDPNFNDNALQTSDQIKTGSTQGTTEPVDTLEESFA